MNARTVKTVMMLCVAVTSLVSTSAEAISPFPVFSKPRAITKGPKDHFFASYYAINSWSPDNRYALVLETDIKDKLPDGRPATIGVVDTLEGDRFIPFSTTRCWNFQEAAMAHWLPWAEDTVVFNDMREGKFCAVVMNWKTKAERVIPYPIAAVSEDGEWAISINYARLFITRPDYGYYGNGQDPRKDVVFPEDDGLWRVNLRTGEAKLIVSCAAVKDMVPEVKAKNGMSYLCHVVVSKDMKRLYFLSRSVEESFEGVKKFKGVKWQTTAFTCNADGTGIRRCFPDGWGSSHFNWKPALSERDGRTMTVTAKWQNRVYTHVEFTVGEETFARQVGGTKMDFDGHCLYTPDGKFISGDGYWDKEFNRHWKMVRLADNKIVELGKFFVPEIYRDIYARCDLHPRWRPDGKQLGFNSVHEGSRQVYVLDVMANRPVKRPALVPAPREVTWLDGVCPAETKVSESRDASIPSEGYRLEVTCKGVTVVSSDDAGAFYARQTLGQLEFEKFGKRYYQCCRIVDSPAYPWRAMLIDEGRHFLGKETAKRVIKLISMHKYNRLHWHLTEDQGWRLDIPGMPEFAKYASVRAESPSHGSTLKGYGNFRYKSTELNGQQYGPFYYTRKDIEEVVAYAKSRHVEIVPEIELPGHAMAALAAFPELSCFPESVNPRMAASDWGIFTNVFCVGNDKTLRVLEKVMDYVCEVFPSEVIHIGGDECPRVNWERCPKCQARVKAEGLKSTADLQGWITRKMAEYLAKKGRRIMGWDEILAGGIVPKTSIGQSWRTQAKEGAGTEHVSAAAGARNGYDMVLSPHNLCYYTYFSGLQEDAFQYSTKTALTLEKAYGFDPMAGVPAELRPRILGAEACCWGEYTWNEYDLMWKMWPRACAMAEILWTDPQPRNFADFRERVKDHRKRLVKMYVNCQPVE